MSSTLIIAAVRWQISHVSISIMNSRTTPLNYYYYVFPPTVLRKLKIDVCIFLDVLPQISRSYIAWN